MLRGRGTTELWKRIRPCWSRRAKPGPVPYHATRRKSPLPRTDCTRSALGRAADGKRVKDWDCLKPGSGAKREPEDKE